MEPTQNQENQVERKCAWSIPDGQGWDNWGTNATMTTLGSAPNDPWASTLPPTLHSISADVNYHCN